MKFEDFKVGKTYKCHSSSSGALTYYRTVLYKDNEVILFKKEENNDYYAVRVTFGDTWNDWGEYREPEYRWFNFYKTSLHRGTASGGYMTKAEADSSSIQGRVACIRIDVNTGECVNEPI